MVDTIKEGGITKISVTELQEKLIDFARSI